MTVWFLLPLFAQTPCAEGFGIIANVTWVPALS